MTKDERIDVVADSLVDLISRVDDQDKRIELLWQYTHEHRETIRQVVDDAAKASRAAASALELLTQVLCDRNK